MSSESGLFLAMMALCVAALMIASCASGRPAPDKAAASGPAGFRLTSSAFAPGGPIPAKYTGEGTDVSPPLAWENVPPGTKELALICDDPDAPGGTWVHWVLAKLPLESAALPEGASSAKAKRLAAPAVDGKNDFRTIGYQGPMPPPGRVHHYVFRLYALDVQLAAKAGADKPSLLAAMDGHILATAELVGTFRR